MADIYEYKVYCTVHAQKLSILTYESDIKEVPEQCPIDSAHAVAANSLYLYDTHRRATVHVDVENPNHPKTGGNPYHEGFQFTVPASTTQADTISLPFPVSVTSIEFENNPACEGDLIKVDAAPDTLVGGNVAAVSIGDTVLDMPPGIAGVHVKVGYHLYLDDQAGTVADMGRVLAADASLNTLTMETPSTAAFAVGTALVFCTMPMSKSQVGAVAARVKVGSEAINAHYLPANMPIRVTYTNTSSTTPATYRVWVNGYY